MQTFSDSQGEYIKRTKKARADSGKNQQEIADFLGIERTTYTGYEISRPMPGKYVSKFCAMTGVTERWLLTGEGPQKEDPWIQEKIKQLAELDDAGRQAFEGMLKAWPKKSSP